MVEQQEKINNDSPSPDVESEVARQQDRQQEWGLQFDKWLINCARRNLVIELLLYCTYPGVTKDGNIVHGIPKRVDKYFIQVVVDSVEVWINKAHIIGCKHERHPATINEN